MKYYDFSAKRIVEGQNLTDATSSESLFIVCSASEVPRLSEVFGFDERTVVECTDFEKNVCCASFEGYDFVSAVILRDNDYEPDEVDFYAAPNYCVLVLPDRPSEGGASLAEALESLAEQLINLDDGENTYQHSKRIYYMFWQGILAQYTDLLAHLETEIEVLSEALLHGKRNDPFESVDNIRHRCYKVKKYLRALYYLSAQVISDCNGLFDEKYERLYNGVETRLRMLFEFADGLYTLCGELFEVIQSRMNMRTEDSMNKLTVIMLFFAPLTVITGIYGMNFQYMPELHWRAGYPFALSIMAIVLVILWIIVKKKKWL